MRAIRFICILSLILTGSLFAQGGEKCLTFAGSNIYGLDNWVNCGSNSLNITDSLTIEAWIKASNAQPRDYVRIVDKYNWASQEGFNLVLEFLTSGGSVMLDFFATDGSKNTVVAQKRINDNQWHHIAVSYDGHNVKIYIDGNLDAQSIIEAKTIKESSDFLGLGNGFDGATWFPYNGRLDEVRLWNTALDSTVIRDWMYKTLEAGHPEYGRLVGYWRFDEGMGSKANDMSAFNNTGKLTDMDTINAWQNSTAPVATSIVSALNDLAAVWASIDSNTSSILSVKDTISGDGSIIFGHNGADSTWNTTDVPSQYDVAKRLNRIWRFEIYDTLKSDIIFDLTNLAGADDLAVLLASPDQTFVNADTIHGELYRFGKFHISNLEIEHGYYYTVGIKDVSTAIKTPDNHKQIVKTIHLVQNYPNPFNPTTVISYQLSENSYIELSVYDIAGRKIMTLEKGRKSAGIYNVTFNAEGLPSGVYIYKLTAGLYEQNRKMILLR